jgi:hypothetical protein
MPNETSGTAAPAGLARFITSSGWFRPSDQTVKQDAFIPYPTVELSVTKHGLLSEDGIWEAGKRVALARPAKLYGRADIFESEAEKNGLGVVDDPTAENPNHALITGWPAEKPAQKAKAQLLAKAARFLPLPLPEDGRRPSD